MEENLLPRIRLILVLFAAALVASGLTAIPVQWELETCQNLASVS